MNNSDSTARLWCTNQVTPLRLFVGHTSDVNVVRFHPNCNYVATASADTTARLFDVQTGACVRVFVGHTSGVRALAMDPTGRYAATGDESGEIRVWDLGSGRQVNRYEYTPATPTAATGASPASTITPSSNSHSHAINVLEYSADTELLASGSNDGTVRFYEPTRPHSHSHTAHPSQLIHVLHTKRTPVQFLTFTPRNLLLAAGVFHPSDSSS